MVQLPLTLHVPRSVLPNILSLALPPLRGVVQKWELAGNTLYVPFAERDFYGRVPLGKRDLLAATCQ
jgi:hypothetical protein